MTDLRAAVEEAMMQAERDAGFLTDPTATAIAFDAILDTLADRADEWADSGREFDTISSAGNVTDKGYVFRLIAVLRGDTDV